MQERFENFHVKSGGHSDGVSAVSYTHLNVNSNGNYNNWNANNSLGVRPALME